MAVANKLTGKPVVMISVNSGNSRGQVQSYARKHKITMPIIVDSDRSLERQLKVGEISLQNIWAAAILTADGRVTRGNSRDLEASATQALRGAKWNVDPQNMPAELRSAWQAIEFGSFAAGASAVKKGLKSRKSEVKEAAEQLSTYVNGQMEEQLESAEKAAGSDKKFEAYRLYAGVERNFKGFEVPEDVSKQVRELSEDAGVKSELAAFKRLDLAKKAMGSTSQTARKRAFRLLESLVKSDPDTQAGKEAQAILAQLKQ